MILAETRTEIRATIKRRKDNAKSRVNSNQNKDKQRNTQLKSLEILQFRGFYLLI